MRLAERLSRISASPTMLVMEHAQQLKAKGLDVIDLGPGQPDFPTPDAVKAAGIAAIEGNFTNYTPAAGTRELRQAIADTFNRRWDTDFTAANVIVTCGAKHAIYNVCQAVFQRGDEVLVPAPYWVTFPEAVRLADAVPMEFATERDEGFVLGSEFVEESLTDKSRGLIVNTPNNPTGAVIPGEAVEALVELSRERDFFLLFDETYEHFTYPAGLHTSLAARVDQEEDSYAVIGSFSKTYSMTGWRVGYCVGPRSLIARLEDFQSHQSGNPPSISQKAAMAALEGGTAIFEPMREEYERRRTLILDLIESLPGFDCSRTRGSFYVFPNVEESINALGLEDSVEFARLLLNEALVATVPGSAFGWEGHLRLSYATSPEKIRTGMERIRTALAG